MDNCNLPAPLARPPNPSVRESPAGAPSLWAALGLIAFYFLLQATGSLLIAVAIGLATGSVQLQQGIGPAENELQAMMAQADMQALTVLLTVTLAAILTLWLAWRRWPQLWSLPRPPGFGFALPATWLFLVPAVAIGLAAPLLGGLLTELLAHGHAVTQDIQQLGSRTALPLRVPLVLVVASLGPLVEELLFRGVLLSALLRRWRTGWAMAISSLLFALAHLPGLQYQWFALPDLALLALALAWLRLRSGSIWPGVVAHGVNNLLAVVAWFVVVNPTG
ncbi:MAG: CPBP family intramembrane metalloprotease [Xanthomonadaceae bacterium]|nr:CPBP family intramembrane metalloprotease [Xanthomonadaceae bacterium]MDE3072838.1 CPBP family intramembrane metalloprotease [Pseudomonadota bacterium]